MRFYGPSPEPPTRVPRMHNVIPNAKAYIAVLQSRFITLGGTIMCNAPVEELVRKDGRVTGIEARIAGKTVSFAARRGVVLAAGDYTNCPELIGKYKGPRFTKIEGINPHATGEGHFLAERIGARLLNMDITYGPEIRFVPPARKPFSQLLPAAGFAARLMARSLPLVPRTFIDAIIKRLLVTWQHPEDKLFAEGAILINRHGDRFCDEIMTPEREIAIAEQPGKICYILLDKRLMQRFSAWPYYISTAPEIAYAYAKDYRRMRPDITVVATGLDRLAKLSGLSFDHLQAAVEAFNRYVSGEIEDPFGRRSDDQPLEDGQWMLLGPAKAYFSTAEGGVAINTSFQVLNTDGQPIEGLYAVGSNALSGMVLWGHGLHIAWAITSGRLLGELLGRA
jgi:succinate dehydrogenase/fumarate reductase flavoprotein subunit